MTIKRNVKKIAVFGDIHNYFDENDLDFFHANLYDLYFFTGDLGGKFYPATKKTLYKINKITREKNRIFILPGNHDGPGFFMLAGELFRSMAIQNFFLPKTFRRINEYRKILSRAFFDGYHNIFFSNFTLLMARPFSMGSRVNYPPLMQKLYNVSDYRQSIKRYKTLIDEIHRKAPEKPVLILSHNGPKTGGKKRDDLWGSDFTRKIRDWGEIDLKLAIEYGKKRGLDISAVIAGHMHRTPKQPDRKTMQTIHNTIYLNAADVPRITPSGHSFYEIILKESNITIEKRAF